MGTSLSCPALAGTGWGARPPWTASVSVVSSLQSSGATPTSIDVSGCWSCGAGAIPVAPCGSQSGAAANAGVAIAQTANAAANATIRRPQRDSIRAECGSRVGAGASGEVARSAGVADLFLSCAARARSDYGSNLGRVSSHCDGPRASRAPVKLSPRDHPHRGAERRPRHDIERKVKPEHHTRERDPRREHDQRR